MNLKRIKGIEPIHRTDVNLSIRSLHSCIGHELVALQTIAFHEYLIVLSRNITYQALRRSHPQRALVFDDTANIVAWYVQRYRIELIFFNIIPAKSIHSADPYLSVPIYQNAIYLIADQCSGLLAMLIIFPTIRLWVVLKQSPSLCSEPKVTFRILINIYR